MQDIPPEQSLIEYPSDFPIKVMGRAHPHFAQTLTDIVLQFDPHFDPATVEMRPSKGGKYIRLTFTVRATSRDQLYALRPVERRVGQPRARPVKSLWCPVP